MNTSIETPDWQREGKEVVNEMLTDTFNSILRIEEKIIKQPSYRRVEYCRTSYHCCGRTA